MKRYLFLLSLISTPAPSYANDTFEDSLPAYITEESRAFLTLTVENDLFGSGTDSNYTNGVRLTYFNDAAEPPATVKAMGRATDNTSIYYSIGQNIYTPQDIETLTPDPNDRPYAALLYASVGYSTLNGDHIDDVELTFGVVGPSALGEQAQKTVHDAIGSPDPRGWDSQLNDEPVIMAAYQRTWPEAFAMDLSPVYLRVAPYTGLTLGNIYTYANTGVILQLVPSRHKWQAPPARVRPSIPGSGYFAIPKGEFSWSLFGGIEGRAVAHNIFLDGNTFEDSPSVDKRYGVLDANLGLTLTYGRTQMAYTLNWRSDEFENQPDNSLFGSVSLGYRF